MGYLPDGEPYRKAFTIELSQAGATVVTCERLSGRERAELFFELEPDEKGDAVGYPGWERPLRERRRRAVIP